jgi:hypothetical protein
MTWFRALPLLWRLVTVFGLVAGLSGLAYAGVAYVRHQGYVAGVADAEATCEREKAEQAQANRDAITEVEKRLMRSIDQAATRMLEIDDAVAQVDQAAPADVGGARECLPPSSVRRLNTVR